MDKENRPKSRTGQAMQSDRSQLKANFSQALQFALITDPDGRVVKINKMCPKICSNSEESLVGFPLWDAPWCKAFPEVVKNTKSAVQDVLNNDVVHDEALFVDKNGDVRLGVCIFTPILDAENKITLISVVGLDISDSNEAEQRYRTLFSTMMQGVVYQDGDGNITSANPAAQRILGLSLAQMQGRTSFDPRWRAIHEDGSDFPGEAHPSMVALETGKEVRDAIMGVFHPEREKYVWIKINAIPVFRSEDKKACEVYTVFEDITKQKDAEKKFYKSEQKYKRLVEDISPICVLYSHTVDSVMQYISPSVSNLIDMEPNDFIGRKWTEVVDWLPESIEKGMDTLNRVLKGELDHADFDMSFLDKERKLKTLHVVHHPITDDRGEITHIEGVATDITDRKMLEQQLQDLNAKLEEKIDERTADLEDMNVALKVLLKKREEDQRELEGNILENYDRLIMPFLRKLKKRAEQKDHQELIRVLERNLSEVISPFSRKLTDPMQNLTPSEIQIASLIKQGASNKGISKLLNISIGTVTNHRNHIRKKLGLVNTKINLRSHLSTL